MAEKERLIEKSKKVISEEIMKQSGKPADEADISSSTIGQSLTIRLLSREAALLNKIECGSFGICESCDDAIDLKRLKARPVAELCIKCKEVRREK
jgi:DnaK suppressor protein